MNKRAPSITMFKSDVFQRFNNSKTVKRHNSMELTQDFQLHVLKNTFYGI